MPTVELEQEEWQKVMAVLSQAPWNVANPLLMKIGDQLRHQKEHSFPAVGPAATEKRQ